MRNSIIFDATQFIVAGAMDSASRQVASGRVLSDTVGKRLRRKEAW